MIDVRKCSGLVERPVSQKSRPPVGRPRITTNARLYIVFLAAPSATGNPAANEKVETAPTARRRQGDHQERQHFDEILVDPKCVANDRRVGRIHAGKHGLAHYDERHESGPAQRRQRRAKTQHQTKTNGRQPDGDGVVDPIDPLPAKGVPNIRPSAAILQRFQESCSNKAYSEFL